MWLPDSSGVVGGGVCGWGLAVRARGAGGASGSCGLSSAGCSGGRSRGLPPCLSSPLGFWCSTAAGRSFELLSDAASGGVSGPRRLSIVKRESAERGRSTRWLDAGRISVERFLVIRLSSARLVLHRLQPATPPLFDLSLSLLKLFHRSPFKPSQRSLTQLNLNLHHQIQSSQTLSHEHSFTSLKI